MKPNTGASTPTAPTRGMPAGPAAASARARADGDDEAEAAPATAEQQALGQHVADQAAASGAERRPDGDVALPRLRRARAGGSRRWRTRSAAGIRPRPAGGQRGPHVAQDLVLQADRERPELHVRRVEALPGQAAVSARSSAVAARGALRPARVPPPRTGRGCRARARRVDGERDPQLGGLGGVLAVVGRQLEPGGMTPTTACGRPSRWIVRPSISGSPPKRRCQSPWPRTTTVSRPGTSSVAGEAAAEQRLRAERVERLAVTWPMPTRTGSPAPVRLICPVSHAATCRSAAAARAVVVSSASDTQVLSNPVHWLQIMTRRPARRRGAEPGAPRA